MVRCVVLSRRGVLAGRMATPRQIGRYRVERLLGTGSFATVWLAYDPGLDGRVALKILAENWSLDDDVKRRFLEEARILWRAQNDRIVRVHLVDQHEGRPFFVMDYADRGTLHERIRDRYGANQRYSVEEAVAMAREIAACLAVAHDLGIVHRDLKPSNLLFQAAPERRSGAPTERLMLADFGLARRLEVHRAPDRDRRDAGVHGAGAGRRAARGRVDERSDIFSANAILYELLAGKPPFTGRSIDSVARRAAAASRCRRSRRCASDIPDALDAVIRRGLAYDPAERHATGARVVRGTDGRPRRRREHRSHRARADRRRPPACSSASGGAAACKPHATRAEGGNPSRAAGRDPGRGCVKGDSRTTLRAGPSRRSGDARRRLAVGGCRAGRRIDATTRAGAGRRGRRCDVGAAATVEPGRRLRRASEPAAGRDRRRGGRGRGDRSRPGLRAQGGRQR